MWTCYTFTEDSHNTGNFMPYSFRIMCGFFNVPQNCEQSRVVRRGLRFIVVIREDLKVLTICRCNYKGSTFSSVILRPWVLVRPESNSRPPAGQTVAQLTEPPVRGSHRSAVPTGLRIVCIIMLVVLAWKTKAILLLLNLQVIYSISWIQLSMLNSRFCLLSLWIIVLSSFATKHSFGSFSFLNQKLKH